MFRGTDKDGNETLKPKPSATNAAVDIVKENEDKFLNEGMENLVPHGFKSRWHVSEAERYHQELKESSVCPESCLGDVVWVHSDLVVPAP